MSEACHCCGGDVLQARVACLGYSLKWDWTSEKGGSHPSSPRVHPDDKQKDLSPKWRKQGEVTVALLGKTMGTQTLAKS